MINKYRNTAPIIPAKKPSVPPPLKTERKYPVGTKVYAILRGGNEDGQIVEAKVKSHQGGSVIIQYEREDGMPAIEPVSILDISRNIEILNNIISQTRSSIAEISDTMQTVPAILNGEGAETLKASIQLFKLNTGDIVAIATDKGKNYGGSAPNQDRGLVVPEKNFIAVFDGIGGNADGDKAADICAKAFLESPDDPEQSFNSAALSLSLANINNQIASNAGSCFISAKIIKENGQKLLDVSQAGDAKLVVYDKDGEIKFESQDESLVQKLVSAGAMTPDEALYSPYKNQITNAILMDRDASNLKKYPYLIPLSKSDRIVMASDGITDNLTPDEIWDLINSRESQKAIEEISDVTDERMTQKEDVISATNSIPGGRGRVPVYIDGFKSTPKPDNRVIAIVDIN